MPTHDTKKNFDHTIDTRQFVPNCNEISFRLDHFLTIRIPRLSRTQAQKIIENNAVTLKSQRKPKNNTKILPGEIVYLNRKQQKPILQLPEIELILQNEDFYVFNKPAGILTHPTATQYMNTMTAMLAKQQYPQTWITHRLDKETSGLIIMAKSQNTAGQITAMFKNSQIKKTYIAIADNTEKHFSGFQMGTFNTPLGFVGIHLPKITMGKGKLTAETHYKPIKYNNNKIMIELIPVTGRQHQLRVHMALNNTPIFGDKLYYYGEKQYKNYLDAKEHTRFYPERLMLHAQKLQIPWKNQLLTITAPTPPEFNEFWNEIPENTPNT